MAIKLYSYWRSSAAYRIRIALNLKRLDHEIVPVSLAPHVSENRQQAYRDKNPQMLIPFFEDGEIAIAQSTAIFEYLEEAYPEISLMPTQIELRSRVRAFANAIACDIHPLQNLRVQKRIKSEFDGDGVAWAGHWITEGFAALESMAGSGPFAFGDAPTMADAFLVPQIYNARRFKVKIEDFPKLVSIYEHCNQLAAFEAAAPEKQIDATST